MKDIIITNSEIVFEENNVFIIYLFWDTVNTTILNILLIFDFYYLFLS